MSVSDTLRTVFVGISRAFAGVALANLVIARATIEKQPAVLATGVPMPDCVLR